MIRALLACLALAACGAELTPARTSTRDTGGSVYLRALEIRDLEARGEPKRIAGSCSSACTMYLGLSTACFEPGAELRFHGPRLAFGLRMTDAQFEEVSRFMASYYPPRIARRFLAEWRYSQEIHAIPASRLIARGEARACD